MELNIMRSIGSLRRSLGRLFRLGKSQSSNERSLNTPSLDTLSSIKTTFGGASLSVAMMPLNISELSTTMIQDISEQVLDLNSNVPKVLIGLSSESQPNQKTETIELSPSEQRELLWTGRKALLKPLEKVPKLFRAQAIQAELAGEKRLASSLRGWAKIEEGNLRQLAVEVLDWKYSNSV